MNLSAFLITIAHRAAQRARAGDYESQLAVLEAVAFAWFAVEALLNEEAYIEIYELGHGSEIVYVAVERGAQGFDRVQAILTYLLGRRLTDGENPANDLKHLARLRNGLVHYKFENPPATGTLNDLAQRGYLNMPPQPWNRMPLPWASQVRPELAEWAYRTACESALAIAALMPHDAAHEGRAAVIRANFEPRPLDEDE